MVRCCLSGFAPGLFRANKRGGLVEDPQQSAMDRCLYLLFQLLLASLQSSHSLPLQSTTVHRVDATGRVKSHGGFLGGYPFKVSGLTRSFAPPDFILRRGGNLREETIAEFGEEDDTIPDVQTATILGSFPYNLAS